MNAAAELAAAAARAAGLLASADGLLVTAGAGMGVDSGLPDFRGDEGFWRAYPALGRARVGFTAIASPAAFRDDPVTAWGFYGHRLALYRRTVPHPGFAILQAWAARLPRGAFVFTSNVDGQFQRAGFAEQWVLECHGSIHHLQCLEPCNDRIWSADGFEPLVDEAACALRNAAPRCAGCGALARPNVLMFGDAEWLEARTAAQERRLDAWLAAVRRPLVVELGAGTAIPSVRIFGERIARLTSGGFVRINPRDHGLEGVRHAEGGAVALACGALAGLRAIDALAGPVEGSRDG
ncbi:MAG: Sir2 family NAD-dependent protein deacetylase [Steroidobacteraceae bacterium]